MMETLKHDGDVESAMEVPKLQSLLVEMVKERVPSAVTT
jgi:hypothetical protein